MNQNKNNRSTIPNVNKIGNVAVEESVNKESFTEIIWGLDLKPPIIIKPNWGFSVCFTEATILDWVLSAVDGDTLVVESYGWARSKDMLVKGEWGSFERADLRKSDEWFMDYSGIGKVLEKHGVEFLNITEEYWAERTASPDEVKELVEAKHQPLVETDFLGFVPSRLYEMRDGTLLSLAKVRTLEAPMWVSLSVKNLFGMIPGPSRGKYHGRNHDRLNQSIVDICKVYDSLFDVRGVVEAVHTASVRNRDTMEWRNIENPGFMSASMEPVELDAVITGLLGTDPNDVGYLKLASETFGAWDDEAVDEGIRSAPDFTYLTS
jgi:uncharacterized protein (DUF362 family)